MKTWNDIKRFDSAESSNVSKFVFEKETAVVEAVLYKYPTYEDRTVICCSTQAGCKVGCKFCGAAEFFARNLTSVEIASQPIHLLEQTGISDISSIKKLQIMFMSMGEPFNNYWEVKEAIEILSDRFPNADLLISTSAPGHIASDTSDKFDDFCLLSQLYPKVGLQFSVHESTNKARTSLIPTHTCTLEEISNLGDVWNVNTGRHPFFNYCVHPGNDTEDDATRLRMLFSPSIWNATISVICEKNETIRMALNRQEELARAFAEKLLKHGFNTRVFNPAGQSDIGGGCGQLWYVQDWAKRNNKIKSK